MLVLCRVASRPCKWHIFFSQDEEVDMLNVSLSHRAVRLGVHQLHVSVSVRGCRGSAARTHVYVWVWAHWCLVFLLEFV